MSEGSNRHLEFHEKEKTDEKERESSAYPVSKGIDTSH